MCVIINVCVCVCGGGGGGAGVHTELIVECDALKHALVGECLFHCGLGDQPGALGWVPVLNRHQEERERSCNPSYTV